MKRSFAMSSGACLIMAAVLGACSGNDTGQNHKEPSATDSAAESNMTAPGTYPIVNDPITLKVMIGGANFADLETNAFTKWYEHKTNINLDFDVLPSGTDGSTRLNLAITSGDLPDVVIGYAVSPSQQMLYGKQGQFVDLKPLIDKYGANIKKMFEEYPGVEDSITTPDGQIFALPQINECYQCSLHEKAWVYQPWLDKLGLKMPETIDDFYQMLKAFKEEDPNGNGKADEIPLLGTVGGYGSGMDRFLMSPFVHNNQENGNSRLSVDNGKIVADYVTPGWKQGLEWIRKLYAEGLIAKDSFTMKSAEAKQVTYRDGVVTTGVLRIGGPSAMFNLYDPATNGAGWGYTAIPPLEGPAGRSTPWNPTPFSRPSGEFVMTKANEHPEETMRWVDGMYSQEVTFHWMGEPGKDYNILDRKDPKALGLDGQPALWEALAVTGTQNENTGWSQIGPSFRDKAFTGGQKADEKSRDQVLMFQETLNKYEPYKQDIDTILPQLFFDEEQSNELADISASINSYVSEMFDRFVTGDADIETGWEDYLHNLDQMGLQRYLDIYQEAFDAKK